MAKVAIAILNYNGREHLKKFLPSVIEHSAGNEVIIGDNGSIDDSIKFLQTEFPRVKVIDLKKNHGYAGGYNRLLEQINHEYAILLNSDVEVTSGWITPLLNALEVDSNVAAVQPKILSYNDRSYFEYAGGAGGYIDKYGYPFCRGRVFSTLEKDLGQYDDDRNIFWASGACFMVRTSAFKASHGFDETYFAHMEEIDLCWRFQKAGYSIRYTGASKVYHLGGGTLSYSSPRKTFLNFKNSWLTILKNTETHRFGTFSIRFILDLFSIIFFLARLQLRNAFSVIRALLFIAFSGTKVQRNYGTSTKNSSKNNPGEFSLVWQYYIRRKKRFSDLIPD